MKVSTSQFFRQAVEIIGSQHSDVAKQQARLGTGKQLVKPSDDAQKAALIQKLKSGLASQINYGSGLESLRTRLVAEESAISTAENMLLRIKELAVRGASESMSTGDRKIISVETDALLAEIMSLANTRDSNGNYIFSGSKVKLPAFIRDVNGKVSYSGDVTQSNIFISDQRTIKMNSPGDEVFKGIIRDGNAGRYSGDLSASNDAGLVGLSFAHKDFVLRAAELRSVLGKADAEAKLSVNVPASGLNLSGSLRINGVTITGSAWSDKAALVTAINNLKGSTHVAAEIATNGNLILSNDAGYEGDAIVIEPVVGNGANALGINTATYSSSSDLLAAQTQAEVNYDRYHAELHASSYDSEIDWALFHSIDSEAYDRAFAGTYIPGSPNAERVGFFTVLDDLVNALALSDSPKIEKGIEELEMLIQNTALSIADIGGRMAVIDSQEAIMDETRIRFESLISEAEDLDYSTAVTELSAEMLALEAAQSSFAKIAQLSLFDYLR